MTTTTPFPYRGIGADLHRSPCGNRCRRRTWVAHIYVSSVIDAPIEEVQAIARDFTGHWHSSVIVEPTIEEDLPSDRVGCVRAPNSRRRSAARGPRRAVRRALRVQLSHPRVAVAGRGLPSPACGSRSSRRRAPRSANGRSTSVSARRGAVHGRHRPACSRTASPTSPTCSTAIHGTAQTRPEQRGNHAPVNAQLDALGTDRGHRRPARPLRLRQHRDQGRARPIRHRRRAQASPTTA